MKKLLLLIGIAAFSFASCQKDKTNFTPQNKSADEASSPATAMSDESQTEEVREDLAKFLIAFRDEVRFAYSPNATYEDFKQVLFEESNHTLSDQADSLLHGTYLLLQLNIPDSVILNNYGGLEMAQLFVYISDNPSIGGAGFFNISSESSNSMQTLGCKWYQVGCWGTKVVNDIGAWLTKNKDALAALASATSVAASITTTIIAISNN